jgi:hypothetical protein
MAEKVIRIFLSHAGPDKLELVDFLYTLLIEAHLPVKVFVDHYSLEYGCLPKQSMEEAVHDARVGKRYLSRC